MRCSDDAARLPALQNNRRATGVSTLDQLISRALRGISIRRPRPQLYHFTTVRLGRSSPTRAPAHNRSPRASTDTPSVAQYGSGDRYTEQPRLRRRQTATETTAALSPGGTSRLDALGAPDGRQLVIRDLFDSCPAFIDRPTHPGRSASSSDFRPSGSSFLATTSTWGLRHRTVRHHHAVIAHPDLRFGRGK